jgi:hypothetical protein
LRIGVFFLGLLIHTICGGNPFGETWVDCTELQGASTRKLHSIVTVVRIPACVGKRALIFRVIRIRHDVFINPGLCSVQQNRAWNIGRDKRNSIL